MKSRDLEHLGNTLPKGPFLTKNTTTIEKTVHFYYAIVFLLRPHIYYAADPSLRGKLSAILRNMVSARVVFLARRGKWGAAERKCRKMALSEALFSALFWLGLWQFLRWSPLA